MYPSSVAVAIKPTHNENPFKALVESARNLGVLVFDFMYGTPERSKMTYAFAISLSLMGFAIESSQTYASMQGALQECSTGAI